MYEAITKDPDATLDYLFAWETELGEDNISSSTFPAFPSGITSSSNSSTAKAVTLWLSGGVAGQSYQITNRIVTTGGRTMDWVLVVHVTQKTTSVPTGPPFATISEAEAHHPAAEGAEALTVEMMLQTASEWVADLAPRPKPVTDLLSASMTASQDYVPLPKIELWEPTGTVKIENEIIRYSFKESDVTTIYSNPLDIYPYGGPGKLTGAQRGRHATIPSAHAQGATVEDADYPLKARNAELAVFSWLWDTRGYKPSRTGVIGSESYSIDPSAIRNIVKVTMGKRYYGSAQSADVTSSFPRGSRRFRVR